MKAFWLILVVMVFALVGCQQQGLKTGWVNCCIKQPDQTMKCTNMEQGQCLKVGSIVDKCSGCR